MAKRELAYTTTVVINGTMDVPEHFFHSCDAAVYSLTDRLADYFLRMMEDKNIHPACNPATLKAGPVDIGIARMKLLDALNSGDLDTMTAARNRLDLAYQYAVTFIIENDVAAGYAGG